MALHNSVSGDFSVKTDYKALQAALVHQGTLSRLLEYVNEHENKLNARVLNMICKSIAHSILYLNDEKSLIDIKKMIRGEKKPTEKLKIYLLILLTVMREVRGDKP